MIHGRNLEISELTRRRWLPAALSATVALLLYAPTLWGTFIYDDLAQAVSDPRLADIKRWGEYFTEAYFPSGPDRLWRPLVSISYALQYQWHGPIAWPFHGVNILLHAAVSAGVAMLGMRIVALAGSGHELQGEPAVGQLAMRCGLLSGLLFAVHPVHVEAVAYIVGRADLLCTAGTVGALLLALSRWTPRRAIGIFICIWVAIFSKEQGLMAPLMIAGIWMWKGRLNRSELRDKGTPFDSERAVARGLAAILTLTLAGYMFYRQRMFSWTWDASSLDTIIQPLAESSTAERLLSAVAILGRAAQLMIAPLRLTPEYGYAVITPHPSWADPYGWGGLIVLIAGIAILIANVRRRKWAAVFLIGCAGVTYGVVSNVTLIGTPFGERLLYLPSVFLLLLIGFVYARWIERRHHEQHVNPAAARHARWAELALFLLIGIYGGRSLTYAIRWNDRLTFLETCLAENPRAVRLAVLVAEERIRRREWVLAERAIADGLAIAPDYWKLWSQGMWVAIEERKFAEATHWREGAWKRGGYPPDLLWLEGLLERRAAQYAIEVARRHIWPGVYREVNP